jgi:YegS/Rv2252/BmrU family lipid kinase
MNHGDKKDWLVIVNPNAGNGRGRKDWHVIENHLHNSGLKFNYQFTTGKGHATELSFEGITQGYRNFITVGGDGTLNEVVNGIFRNKNCNPCDTTIGLIPVGTGNDWGKMFGIPLDHAEAVKIIDEGKEMLHDVGIIIYHEGQECVTRYFINIAGMGFESEVVRRTNYLKEKGWGGRLIYLYNLLITLFSYKFKKAVITIDSNDRITTPVFSINIGNGRYCGGGMRQTPEALPDDGLLDVTIIKAMGKLEIIRNLIILYNGKILEHPKIEGFRGKKICIDSESLIYTEADGESLGHSPAEFGIIPAGIRIIYRTKLI